MARYALIDAQGNVTNAMEWDGDTENWSPPEGHTAVLSEVAQRGWTYDARSATFSEPVASPERLTLTVEDLADQLVADGTITRDQVDAAKTRGG